MLDHTCRFRREAPLSDLVADIAAHGVRTPVLLRKRKGIQQLQIVCGFRRIQAARILGEPVVPAHVYHRMADQEALAAALVDNERTNPLDMIDKGRAALAFRRSCELDDQALARLMRATPAEVELWMGLALLSARGRD